jgi:hypothetical protein
MNQGNQSWIPVRNSAAIQAANISILDDSDSIDLKLIGKLASDMTEIKKIVKAVHKVLENHEKQPQKGLS